MSKWKAWVVEKRYYEVELEGETWEEARELANEADVDRENPHMILWDVYDVVEKTI